MGWGAPLRSWWWCQICRAQESRILLPFRKSVSTASHSLTHSVGHSVTVSHPCRPGEGWTTIALVCSLPDYGFLDPQRAGSWMHCTIWLYRLQHPPQPKPPCDTCDITLHLRIHPSRAFVASALAIVLAQHGRCDALRCAALRCDAMHCTPLLSQTHITPGQEPLCELGSIVTCVTSTPCCSPVLALVWRGGRRSSQGQVPRSHGRPLTLSCAACLSFHPGPYQGPL